MPQDSVTLQLRGLNETIQNLAKTDARLEGEIKKATSSAKDLTKKRAEHYPPARPSSKYIRTMKLKRGWQAKQSSPYEAVVFNEVPYASWVQGETTQAAVHVGRWPTTGDIVRELDRKINTMFEEATKRAIRG